jgi:hypothetical protein
VIFGFLSKCRLKGESVSQEEYGWGIDPVSRLFVTLKVSAKKNGRRDARKEDCTKGSKCKSAEKRNAFGSISTTILIHQYLSMPNRIPEAGRLVYYLLYPESEGKSGCQGSLVETLLLYYRTKPTIGGMRLLQVQ